MAELGAWASISQYGLLSTTALLDLYGKDGQERIQIESEWRAESIKISHPKYGDAVIRDQKPLHSGANKFIKGMTPTEYYRLLNGKVFFWTRRERLVSLLGARAYKGRSHDVLTVDTDGLVRSHEDEITLSPINSGAFFGSGDRGAFTFKKIRDYPYSDELKKRGKDAVVELAVEYAVRDIAKHTINVEEWGENVPTRLIWKNPAFTS
jgi:hypothetical protein